MNDWMPIARGEIGVEEIHGPEHNPRILQYHRETGIGRMDDEEAWCSVFPNWVFLQIGVAGTGSPAARSWLRWGRAISEPVYGCIVILRRAGGEPWQGHVTFYIGPGSKPGTFEGLGGNQRDAVRISTYRDSDVLGYRMPKRPIDSKTIVTATVTGAGVVAETARQVAANVETVSAATGGALDRWTPIIVGVVVAGVLVFVVRERLKKIRERQV